MEHPSTALAGVCQNLRVERIDGRASDGR